MTERISAELARALRDSGLVWRPAAGDAFVIDRVEATSAIFDEFATAEQIDIAALRGGSSVKLSASATDLLEQP